jgi:hypothetical protein
MTKLAHSAPASGTGTVTIEAPVTNTNRTLTLPDEAGTLATTGQVIGVGQTWQNLTGSRAFNTTYTNTTGKPISVMVYWVSASVTQVNVVIDGIFADVSGNNFANSYSTARVIVPVGKTYRVEPSAATTIGYWAELR